MCMCIPCNIYIALGARGLRESSLKMCPKTHQIAQLTRNLGSIYTPIPLNIVCAVIHYLLFLYKKWNILQFFFLQNFSKIFSKTHQIAPFLNIFLGGACPRAPLTNAWLRHALHIAKRHANTPTFTKIFLTPPPPPRNEILDKPLAILHHSYFYSMEILAKTWSAGTPNSAKFRGGVAGVAKIWQEGGGGGGVAITI